MLDFKLKPNTKIGFLDTKITRNKTKHFSTIKYVCFKTIDSKWSDSITTLNTIFNSLNVHVSNFYIIGDKIIRVFIHISVLSQEEKIVSITKDFYLCDIDYPTKQKFKNELYKLVRNVKLKFDKYI